MIDARTSIRAALLLAITALAVTASVLSRPAVPAATALPGVTVETLPAALAAELRALPDGDVHTPHRGPDGRPAYTNRLIRSTSPYLRQHGHDPVNWFEWGDEAFALAKRLNRPVFLSIGYATCHWCHVMQEESFADPEIAALLNERFVAIKLDREVRPDVDAVYVEALRAMRGSAGWPATLWLDAEKRPFYATTYVPARDRDRGAPTGLLTMLREVDRSWREAPEELRASAEQLTAAVRDRLAPAGPSEVPPDPRAGLEAWVRDVADRDRGGRVGKRKFPSGLPLRAMLASPDAEIRAIADHTLLAMLSGGVYDQVAGGFHRYAVDPDWRVPHFEKTLYDNALLARAHAEAFQGTRDLRHAVAVDEILTFLARDLGGRGSGGYASALDADAPTGPGPDAHRLEGAHVTWTETEVRSVLPADRADAVVRAWLTGEPDLDGRYVLAFDAIPTLGERRALGKDRLELLLARAQRPGPLRDGKVLVGWNGLAIAAFAHAGWLLGREDWLDEARGTADLLLEAEAEHGGLPRLLAPDGRPEGTGFLEDHAYLVDGLLTLFEATGELRWLQEAVRLADVTRDRFGDAGAWWGTPAGHEDLLVRHKPVVDGATPGPNAVMVGNLVRLGAITGRDRYRLDAEALAEGLLLDRQPQAAADAVMALTARPLHEVVLVTAEGERATDLLAAVRTVHPSTRVVVPLVQGDRDLPSVARVASGKIRIDGRPTAYVCHGGVCEQPTSDPDVLASLLAARR